MTAFKILLAEDEPVTAHALKLILETEGYQVFQSHNREDLLNLLEGHIPNLVILPPPAEFQDDLSKKLRTLGIPVRFKILFLTTSRSQDLEIHLLYNKKATVLFKPFTPHQLRQTIKKILP